VVASGWRLVVVDEQRFVSIPFIAGQWSLPTSGARRARRGRSFQSPSLRGSGRFIKGGEMTLSNPFLFQSPSLRGSGRFVRCADWCGALRHLFQSPSLRGSGRFERPHVGDPDGSGVSIPFIAGQWSLLHNGLVWGKVLDCFNPLHCGAVVASFPALLADNSGADVSIPFIAGQWSLQPSLQHCVAAFPAFQSPSLRGSGRFFVAGNPSRHACSPGFNPLHCGAVVAS